MKGHASRAKKTVVVDVFQGIVNDVKGLPEGYQYEVKDLDVEEAGDTVTTIFGQIYGAGAGTRNTPASLTKFYRTDDREKALEAWKREVAGKGWTPIGKQHVDVITGDTSDLNAEKI